MKTEFYGLGNGVALNEFLEKFLQIAIFGGIEEGVFERCTTKDAFVSFEFIALLEGITLEAEVEVFKGIRLVPLPSTGTVEDLPRCLGSLLHDIVLVSLKNAAYH